MALKVQHKSFSKTAHLKDIHSNYYYYYYTCEIGNGKKDTELVSGTSNSFPVKKKERKGTS